MTAAWNGLAPAAAIVLAGVFAWAAAAKLARPAATATAFRRLRVPAARAAVVAVPVTELAVAGLLLTRPRTGAAASLLLLAAFSALLAARFAPGTRTGCGCFGSSTRSTTSTVALWRNTLLGALALVCLPARVWSAPTLPAVVTVGAGVAAGAVVLALIELRGRAGRLWSTGPLLERGGEG